MLVEKEIDRILTLLRNKIREQGFTQLEVQEKLGWGRSYISQLLTKQKSLRVEQVLLILSVINVEPVAFYAELYHFPKGDAGLRGLDEYPEPQRGHAPWNPSMVAEPGASSSGGEMARSYRELRTLVRGLVNLLVEKKMVGADELDVAVKSLESGGSREPSGGEGGPIH